MDNLMTSVSYMIAHQKASLKVRYLLFQGSLSGSRIVFFLQLQRPVSIIRKISAVSFAG